MTQLFISCKESRIENNRSFYGSFVLGPFEGGQSLTIANALRRTLLSELKGLAIVSIQIEGVLHEYSSIPGVKDSVLDILLNLKEIHFTSHKAMLPQIGYLRVRGPGIVRASDLKLPPFIKLVDPDQYIATLADDGFLNMKLIISEGKNYMLSSQKVGGKVEELKQNTNSSLGAVVTAPDTIKNKKTQLAKTYNNDFSFNLRRSLLQQMGLILDLENQKTIYGSKIYNLKKRFLRLKKNSTNKLPENLPNSNPLMIDSVFAPVTKVNYMIEYSEHKTIDTSFSNAQEINQIFNFLAVSPAGLLPTGKPLTSIDTTVKSLNNIKNINLGDKTKLEILNLKNQLSYVNIAKDSLKPSSIKQNVIIEIWTNGSMHPRDALNEGLKNMFKVFYNLYKIGSLDFTLSNTNKYARITPVSDLKMSSLFLNSLKHKEKVINSATLSKLKKLNRKKPIITKENKNVIPINKSFFSSL